MRNVTTNLGNTRQCRSPEKDSGIGAVTTKKHRTAFRARTQMRNTMIDTLIATKIKLKKTNRID